MNPARQAALLQAYQHAVEEVVQAARAAGIVVTVDQVPLKPLTMGHYRPVVSVRPEREFAHELYTDADPDAPQSVKDRNGSVVLALCKRCGLGEAELDYPCVPRRVQPALASAPPKPLTDADIDTAYEFAIASGGSADQVAIAFARAIERTHGIGDKP